MHRRSRNITIAGLAVGAMVTGVSLVCGDPFDSQGFTGEVASVLVVTSPTVGDVSQAVTTDADVVFAANPADPWVVECNGVDGGTIDFVAGQPFTHSTASAYKRDVQLDLVLASSETGSGWAVTTASDSTDYGTAVMTATVTAASTAAGDATFDLTVTLKTINFSTMAAGDYETTITGTLTAN